MDNLLSVFLIETRDSLDTVEAELVKFEQTQGNIALLDHILRLVHNVKGTCGFMQLPRMEALIHASEAALISLRGKKNATPQLITTLLDAVDRIKLFLVALEQGASEPEGDDSDLIARLGDVVMDSHDDVESSPAHDDENGGGRKLSSLMISASALNSLMDIASALSMVRHQFVASAQRTGDKVLQTQVQVLTALADDLETTVGSLRKQPVGKAFVHIPRIVRDLSRELEKTIALDIAGADIEIDAEIAEALKAPMAQLVRNAASHGLGTLIERRAAGKPDTGHITITSALLNGALVIRVVDDGNGLGLSKIKEKAAQQHIVSAETLAQMTTGDLHNLVFQPGFSTATPSKISGHGIGLDIVRTSVQALGGSVAVTSKPGKGTIFTLKIPLHDRGALTQRSAAVMSFTSPQSPQDDDTVSFVLFKAGEGAPKAVPFQLITRVEQVSASMIEHVGGRLIVRLGGVDMPVVSVASSDDAPSSDQMLLIFNERGKKFGLSIDAVTDVVKARPDLQAKPNSTSILGSAVIGNDLVEIIDIGHYVALAFAPPPAQQGKVAAPRRNYPLAWSSTGRSYV